MRAAERVLRLYPAAWRDRYGHELLALVEDELDGRRPSLGLLASLVFGALRERLRSSGLVGGSVPRDARVRAGGSLLLWAGTAFVLAVAALGKIAEHAGGGRTLAALRPVAALTGALVLVALAVALRPTARFLAAGGWPTIAPHAWRAVVATTVTTLATVGLVAWAHHLPAAAREHAAWPYATAFVAWGGAVAATLAAWTAVATALARAVPVEPRRLAAEVRIAPGLAAGMWVMTAVTIVWWAQGPATSGRWVGAVVTVMLLADAAAGYGAHRCRTT